MPKNILHTATGLVALAAAAVAQTGNQVAIPTHATVYNGFTRGYNFTAAGDFFIQDLELPLDAQQAGDTAGVVVRVNGVEVFTSVGNAGAIMSPPGPIQIFNGDVVDVNGNWSPVTTGNFTAHNSYGNTAPFATTIEGVATTLNRTGIQWDIGDPAWVPNTVYLAPTTGAIGRVWMYTTPPAGIFASFNASPSSGTSPLSVSFTDTTFTDDPAGVQTWAWDFDGDGTIDSTNQNDTWLYPACGAYDVTLTVTDLINGSSTTTVVGAVNVDPVSASFTVGELAPATGIWQFTDTSSPTPTAWAWDFDGDGIVDDTTQNPIYVQAVPSALLSLPTCTLTVTGVGGCLTDTLVQNVQATGYGVVEGPLAGGNGTLATPTVGVYFDIQVGAGGVNITGLDTAVYTFAGGMDVNVFVTAGTHLGNEGVANAWTLAGTGSGTAVGGGAVSPPELVSITLNQSFFLPEGDYGVALYHTNPAGAAMYISYTNGPAASPYGNSDIVIHPNGVGSSSTTLLGPAVFTPRLWNGRLYYETCVFSNNAAAGTYANGCVNSAGVVPSMTVASMPQLGGNYGLSLNSGLATPAAFLIILGTDKDVYSGLPLPLDLGIVGAFGCELATDVATVDATIALPGANSWSFAVPNNPALICYEFFQQGAVLDTNNALGLVLSNAIATVVGN